MGFSSADFDLPLVVYEMDRFGRRDLAYRFCICADGRLNRQKSKPICLDGEGSCRGRHLAARCYRMTVSNTLHQLQQSHIMMHITFFLPSCTVVNVYNLHRAIVMLQALIVGISFVFVPLLCAPILFSNVVVNITGFSSSITLVASAPRSSSVSRRTQFI